MGARDVVISSNIPLRNDGLPMSGRTAPTDTAIACYFKREGRPFVIACDHWLRTEQNMAGLAFVIQSLRTMERHGSPQLFEHALGGFKQLAAHEANESWWRVLGVESDATPDTVAAARMRLLEQHHPDRGGDHERAASINAAYERACRDLGVSP